jgi:hypothetical protein
MLAILLVVSIHREVCYTGGGIMAGTTAVPLLLVQCFASSKSSNFVLAAGIIAFNFSMIRQVSSILVMCIECLVLYGMTQSHQPLIESVDMLVIVVVIVVDMISRSFLSLNHAARTISKSEAAIISQV